MRALPGATLVGSITTRPRLDSAGNLYGTTEYGGSGTGTVFKVTPAGAETVLYSFSSANGDGAYPRAGLIMDSAGNLYVADFYFNTIRKGYPPPRILNAGNQIIL